MTVTKIDVNYPYINVRLDTAGDIASPPKGKKWILISAGANHVNLTETVMQILGGEAGVGFSTFLIIGSTIPTDTYINVGQLEEITIGANLYLVQEPFALVGYELSDACSIILTSYGGGDICSVWVKEVDAKPLKKGPDR